jgi:hypothetical protein
MLFAAHWAAGPQPFIPARMGSKQALRHIHAVSLVSLNYSHITNAGADKSIVLWGLAILCSNIQPCYPIQDAHKIIELAYCSRKYH